MVKEHIRATIHGMPFKAIPRVLIKCVVEECTRKLNFFPAKHGCSEYFSPREILHERKLNYAHECQIPTLSYVLIHDEPTPTISMQPCALDGIYMRPISNANGGHAMLHLATNEIITWRNLTVIPITPAVIKAVETLAKCDDVFSFKIESKKGVLLYDSSTAGVDDEDVDDVDPSATDEEVEPSNAEVDEDNEVDGEVDQNSDDNEGPVEESDDEEDIQEDENELEEELVGSQQPKVRRST
jgi:hypothetical protein